MRFALLLFSLLGFLPGLRAHTAPGSAVLLDFRSDRIDAELRLPLSELEFGFGQKLEAEPANVVAKFRPQLADYVRQHLAARAPDGRAWTVAVLDMETALQEQPIDLVVRASLHPPKGAPLRRFTLNYDVISHEVMNHIVMVSVRRDGNHAQPAAEPDVIGVMRSFIKELPVDRTTGGAGRGESDERAPGPRGERAPWLVAALALLALAATVWPRSRRHSELSR